MRREALGHKLYGEKNFFKGNLARSKRKVEAFFQELDGMGIEDEGGEVHHIRRSRIGGKGG